MENKNDKEKKLIINGFASFGQQLVSIICGLIVPRLIIGTYGSAANGTIATITQLISVTSIIQGGVASSVRVGFYGPVAQGNTQHISRVFNTSQAYFRRFSIGLLGYILILSFTYSKAFNSPFSYRDTVFMVIVIGVSAVLEYFIGITNQLLLFADQKGYINTSLLAIGTTVSSVFAMLLIRGGASLLTVKIISGCILAIRPIVLALFVKRYYSLDLKIPIDYSVINQRYAALTKSIAFHVHTSTDTIVISLFLSPIWASIYAVHRYVVNSFSTIVSSVLGNMEVVFGHMQAEGDDIKISHETPIYDLASKILSSVFFFTALILITPFVRLYTSNAKDASYVFPVFAFLLCFAEMVYCMSLTYHNMIMAAGHIRETKWISITEAIINVVLSVVLVNYIGIEGVAIGTLVAFAFNTVANIYYMKRNILDIPLSIIIKMYICNVFPGLILYVVSILVIDKRAVTVIQFAIMCIVVLAAVTAVTIVINRIFMREYTQILYSLIIKAVKKQERNEPSL